MSLESLLNPQSQFCLEGQSLSRSQFQTPGGLQIKESTWLKCTSHFVEHMQGLCLSGIHWSLIDFQEIIKLIQFCIQRIQTIGQFVIKYQRYFSSWPAIVFAAANTAYATGLVNLLLSVDGDMGFFSFPALPIPNCPIRKCKLYSTLFLRDRNRQFLKRKVCRLGQFFASFKSLQIGIQIIRRKAKILQHYFYSTLKNQHIFSFIFDFRMSTPNFFKLFSKRKKCCVISIQISVSIIFQPSYKTFNSLPPMKKNKKQTIIYSIWQILQFYFVLHSNYLYIQHLKFEYQKQNQKQYIKYLQVKKVCPQHRYRCGWYSFIFTINIYNNIQLSTMRPVWLQSQVLPKKVESIDFSIIDSASTLKISEAEINHYQIYDQLSAPVRNGPLDLRLGVGNQQTTCTTCFKKLQNCVGHFGHAHIDLPIFHIGYFKHLITILKMVCKSCSRILMPQQEIDKTLVKLRKIQNKYMQRQAYFKKISKEIMKNKICPHCNYVNPVVQKIPKVAGKIQIRSSVMKHQIWNQKVRRSLVSSAQRDKNKSGDFIYELNPWQALQILRRIPQKQWLLINVSGSTTVNSFIVQDLPIPPVCIRPSLKLSSSSTLSNQDDLTMNIKCLIKLNKEIKQTMLKKGEDIFKISKKWYLLQSYWSQYINGDAPGLPINQLKYKQIKSLCNRLKGKQGRFRQNLSGKRSNFTARTVISPDPNLRPDQVIVPEHISKIVTISQIVTANNIQFLQECVEKGQNRGGANFIINSKGQKFLIASLKTKLHLKLGDTVQRHLRDGDIVIFNRQPSLHRISMMGFKVKISSGKTLRFNQCVCAPFNADFDGDQMNIHIPQTYQARSQVLHLMGVKQNIITPKSGQPIVALIQDFLTTSYLITSKDNFFNRQQFTQILSYFADASQLINLPPPAIIKPVALWTGKQVISSLLRPNQKTRIIVNLKTRQKACQQKSVMDLKDGFVLFRNSQLLAGQLGKSTLGGNKSGLIYALLRDNNNQSACEVMHRISKLSSRWLSNYGMTIGIGDVTPSSQLKVINKQAISISYDLYEKYQTEYRNGTLQSKPGMTVKQTLQSLLNTTLSKVRQTIGQNCISYLDRYNKPLIMALCGSKGSNVNLSQMIGCVGQQTVGGKRIQYGFTQRTLPHFARLNQSPQARGFVSNSFYTGLTPTEFFFHTMGGREGIIDTAVKTADTGYMQRRLIKLLEDIGVMYDRTIRTCDRKDIIQFRYGGDGLDPMKTQENQNPINFQHLQTYVKTLLGTDLNTQKYLLPSEIRKLVKVYIQKIKEQKAIGSFRQEEKILSNLMIKVQAYFEDKAKKLQKNIAQTPKLKNKKDEQYLKNCFNGITDKQLSCFFNQYIKKLNKALMQPGQAIGALTAQSIGQPATQMTLKTFHFAGISSMNITQGVPRVNQIINCTKNIATPIITIRLEDEYSTKQDAIVVKNSVQKLVLGKILKSVEQIIGASECRLNLNLSEKKIKQLKIHLNVDYIMNKLHHALHSKIKRITKLDQTTIEVIPNTKTNVIYELKSLRKKIVTVLIGGINTIHRALISKQSNGKHIIYAEGLGLREVLKTFGVNSRTSSSNHILQIQQNLGIEAARNSIINQVSETMREHGVNVNPRHIYLLAEVMTCKGKVIGFTRNGVDKMKDSTIMLASFEKTTDFLFDAATQGKHDRMRGVSQKIIVGQPISVGTGMFDIKWDIPKKKVY